MKITKIKVENHSPYTPFVVSVAFGVGVAAELEFAGSRVESTLILNAPITLADYLALAELAEAKYMAWGA
jgi:hypothetical protein